MNDMFSKASSTIRILKQRMTTKTLKIDILILPHDTWTNVDISYYRKDLYLSTGYNGHYVVFETFHFDIRLTSK